MSEFPRDILLSGATESGIELNGSQLDQFEAFTNLLLEWNQKFNLTRITDPEEVVIKHYLDSISILPFIDTSNRKSLIDVGTGAGFPAIPLKIACPDLKVTLLDSVKKRLTFLDAVSSELGFKDISTVHARAEDAGQNKTLREKYDYSVSRAVARLNILAELGIPFCKPGGTFISYKGPESDAEIQEASKAIKLLGGKLDNVRELTLPHSDIHHTLIFIRKTKPTPSNYPRKAGIPEREPLV